VVLSRPAVSLAPTRDGRGIERPVEVDVSQQDEPTGPIVGRVIGTEDATPLEFWVAVSPEQFIQLDDVVALERTPPGRGAVRIYGVVSQVRARHEGARFDSDVFLISDGVLPAEVSEAAQVLATRFEPEVFVPPLPGQVVRRAEGAERHEALFFDGMQRRLPAGLSRDDQPVYVNLDFVDGTRGAHVNISGVSGVATKTTYATFLLNSMFTSGVLGEEATNTRALIFNVKGEDLLFLDHENAQLDPEQEERYRALGLEPAAFRSVEFWAPPRRGAGTAMPDTGARVEGVTSFFWTLAEFCRDELLPFLFTDAQDDRQQYTMIVHNVTAKLKREAVPLPDGGVRLAGREARTFRDLVDVITELVEDEATAMDWAGRAIGTGTINAFVRRMHGVTRHVEHLIRGDVPNPDKHTIARQSQVTVVDIHNLNDRAKRFVVGVVLRRTFEEKERSGSAKPLTFVVLDELNKYAPRDGTSPIKEILLDIAERGRSLGIILIGAQQTASEVERRVISNSAIRIVGRLDSAEAKREEYGFLPPAQRQRATIVKPGTMIVSQPELPVPLVVEFPFPAWATRPSEAGRSLQERPEVAQQPDDPFAGLTDDRLDPDGNPIPF
jgi:DNA helicase HerA-like ATPase